MHSVKEHLVDQQLVDKSYFYVKSPSVKGFQDQRVDVKDFQSRKCMWVEMWWKQNPHSIITVSTLDDRACCVMQAAKVNVIKRVLIAEEGRKKKITVYFTREDDKTTLFITEFIFLENGCFPIRLRSGCLIMKLNVTPHMTPFLRFSDQFCLTLFWHCLQECGLCLIYVFKEQTVKLSSLHFVMGSAAPWHACYDFHSHI